MPPEVVSLAEKFALFSEHWSPKIVGEVNESYVKLVKLKGEFVWHHHPNEDEMFLVVKGRLLIETPGKDLLLDPGDFVVIPMKLEHRPVAKDEVEVVLFEPKSTLNTGNLENERTRTKLERL